jgi:hypothetical protein
VITIVSGVETRVLPPLVTRRSIVAGLKHLHVKTAASDFQRSTRPPRAKDTAQKGDAPDGPTGKESLLDRSRQFQYIACMRSQTIETRAHTTKEGRLNLSVDVADVDVAVVLTVTPVTAEAPVDLNGWPDGFFDRVAGSMPDLRRGAAQGDFEERLPLE